MADPYICAYCSAPAACQARYPFGGPWVWLCLKCVALMRSLCEPIPARDLTRILNRIPPGKTKA